MKTINLTLSALLSLLFLFSCSPKESTWFLESPDEKIQLIVDQVSKSENLTYSANFMKDGEAISALAPSALGIVRNDGDFSKNLTFKSSSIKEINEKYSTVAGKRINDVNHCNEMTLVFENENADIIEMIFRAYNDGVALRYNMPGKTDKELTITNELTSFNLNTTSGKAWMQTYDTLIHWSLGYEIPYNNEIPIGTSSSKNYGWAFPLLFEKDNGLWMLASEADLNEQYCGMHIKQHTPNGNYQIEFPEDYECYGEFSRYPQSTLPWITPWRFVIIGDSPKTLVESNIVNHLSAPSVIEDESWIEPSAVSWSWWYDALSSSDYIPLKDHVDLSAEMGWKYSLVDADWDIMVNGNIDQLTEYASSKDVGLFLWYNSGGPNNKVMWRYVVYPDSVKTLAANGVPNNVLDKLKPIINKEFFIPAQYEGKLSNLLGSNYDKYSEQIIAASRFNNAGPRDRFYTKEAREKEFAELEAKGIKGIKVDFFMSDKQEVIKLYLNILKSAAEHKIIINTHGSTIPRGWSKTYPNLLTMEAVMGAEMYGSKAWPKLALTQNTVYPFLRNVVGPMDYTPVTFSDKIGGAPHLTTNVHELALSVIYESGLLHVAEGAPVLRKMPEKVLDFLKTVPIVWDDVHFIEGYPGKYCVLAREANGAYYIAGINGQENAVNLSIDTDFISDNKYTASFYLDGKSGRDFKFDEEAIIKGERINVQMKAHGGFVVVLEK